MEKWSTKLWSYQLSWWGKLATVKRLKADVSSVCPCQSESRNGGLHLVYMYMENGGATLLGNLSKHDGDGWRERHKTKGLISNTMILQVRYRFWYISLPSSAKQQREMTKFKVLGRTWTHDSEFSFFYMNGNAVLTESAPGLFGYIRQIERVETIAKNFDIFGSYF